MKKTFLFVMGMMLMTVGFTGCKNSKTNDGAETDQDAADSVAVAADSLALSADSLVVEDSVALGDSLEVVADEAAKEREMEAARAFVEKFYNEWDDEDVLNYDYPKKHITPKMLKFLADSYSFDCEGECLATWVFFYEGGGDVSGLKSRKITAQDETHVLVENDYDNYEYDILLTLVKDGDTFKIDSLKKIKERYL